MLKILSNKNILKKTHIKAKLEEALEKGEAIRMLFTQKSNLLNLNYLYAKFIQDANE